ncbi:MAG: chitobiase/beta-hexosaminidase C-terminal domain-containing protein [Muribaculaceae bacterium]
MKRLFTTLILTALVSVAAFADDKESLEQVASPQFSVMSNVYQDVQFVELGCPTEGAEIYFTLDGSTPTQDSFLYDGNPIVISSTTVLKAVAYLDNNASEVAEAQYVFGGTADVISTILNSLSDIFGGKGTITVNGTDNPSDVNVFSIDGSEINIDEDRATTVKGSGDTPDRVVVKVDDPGIYAVKSPKSSKLVLVF